MTTTPQPQYQPTQGYATPSQNGAPGNVPLFTANTQGQMPAGATSASPMGTAPQGQVPQMPGVPGTDGILARGLTKTYQRGGVAVNALAGVNLTLPQGSQLAIMGPSGCGKTTLLHCLAGILRPTSGTITIGGQDITGLSEKRLSQMRLRNFGFVFQDGQLLPELPCQENIAMPLMLAGTPKREAIAHAQQILANLGLQGAGPYRPGQLSGGQAQRVAIGRALVTNPQVVFADEPTGALDQATGAEVMQVLTQACAATGATLVLVTHDPGVAARLPHTIHMRDGLIVQSVQNAAATTQAPAQGGAL